MVKILQASYPRSGSTLLVNLLHGALCSEEQVHFTNDNQLSAFLITKTHNMDIDFWIKSYAQYELYFIVSEREIKLDQKFHKYKNVLIFRYDDLLIESHSLRMVCEFVLGKIKSLLPAEVFPIADSTMIENMEARINNMNILYEKIKNEPFTCYDEFYHIHGHHRNRGDAVL